MTDPRTVIRDRVAAAIHRTDIAPFADADLYRRQADAAISAHLEALEQAARIDTPDELAEYIDQHGHNVVLLDAHGGAVQLFYDLDPDQYPAIVLWTPGGEQ